MATLEVTASRFRENIKDYFEIADKGSQIVIKRGRKQAYILTPVSDDDFVPSPELLAKLDNIRQQVRNGEYTECLTLEELHAHLDSL